MASDAWSSDIGYHLPATLCQTPPPAVPIQMSSGFWGLTAMAVVLPVSPPGKKQQSGSGPIEDHFQPTIGLPCAGRDGASASARTTNRSVRAALTGRIDDGLMVSFLRGAGTHTHHSIIPRGC